jgi:hypothetical protein
MRVVAAGEHGDRAGREAAAMGGGVDAARETRDHGEAFGAEVAREPLGEAHARRRGVARADDGDRRRGECRDVAAHGKERRSVVDHPQAVRIIRLAQRQQGHAEPLGGRELALCVLPRVDARGP